MDLDLDELPALAAKAPPFILSPGRGSCNWYLQDVGAVSVGGVMTAFRIADQLKSTRGVHQRFLICGRAELQAIANRVLAAFPGLKGSEFIALDAAEKLAAIPPADIGVATLWTTAYVLARVTNCARKMYLIQDFEPLFYPAGSTSAQADLTYRFGFEGLCNTEPLKAVYQDRYGGAAVAFTPQIDRKVFYPGPAEQRWPRARVFFYARPNNPRNAFELSAVALKRLKHRLGSSGGDLVRRRRFRPQGLWARRRGPAAGLAPLRTDGRALPHLPCGPVVHADPAPVLPAIRTDGLRRAGGGAQERGQRLAA